MVCRVLVCRVLSALVIATYVGFGICNAARAQATPQATPSRGTPLRLATRGPVFFSVSHPGGVRMDARNSVVLDRAVALDLTDATIPMALAAIEKAADVQVTFAAELIPDVSPRVTMRAAHITLAAALTDVLQALPVDVELSDDGRLTLVRRGGDIVAPVGHQPAASAGVRGRVTDTRTSEPLRDVSVRAVGTSVGAVTGGDGTFVVRAVPLGRQTLAFRRLGYVAVFRVIDVTSDSTVHIDVGLAPSAQVLDAVVTTISGNQRLLELGQTIGTIPADTVVATSPITTFSDVLNARVPGLQVFEDGGLTGASPVVNIRGQNSYGGTNQPLLYIDGVRVSNTTAQAGGSSGRFNDIDPEAIESIDVVKGPSAAVLYGTDAANGAILITTKRGMLGPARWHLYTQQGTAQPTDESHFVPNYYGWGRRSDGTNAPVNCTLVVQATSGCVLDSVTHFTPLANSNTTPFGSGSRDEYGGQVSGGTAGWRYFFGAESNSETGYLKMPNADLAILRAARGAAGVSSSEVHPNGVADYSAHQNIIADLSPATTVSVAAAYASRVARIPNSLSLLFASLGPGYRDGNDGWGFGERPLYQFSGIHQEKTSHFTGSVNGDWRPLQWLSAHAVAGRDLSSAYLDELVRNGEADPFGLVAPMDGARNNAKDNATLFTYSAYATASVSLPARVTSSTTVGGNYNRMLDEASVAIGTSLAPGCTTITCAAATSSSESNSDTKVAGLFVEERLAYTNSLFLSGGLRADASSTFGNSVNAVLYPKASISWVVSQEPFFPSGVGVESFRLRAAYGESGTQPGPAARLDVESPQPAVVHDTLVSGTGLPAYGNPNLRPERQREVEGGADLDLIGGRVHLEVTAYARHTRDALVQVPAPASLGSYSTEVNAAAVSNRGYEGLAVIRPVSTRFLQWDLSFNGSTNHNKLLSLGPTISPATSVFAPQLRLGYPLYSWFGYPVLSATQAPNGAVLSSSVQIGPDQRYIGASYPSDQLTFGTTVSLFRSVVQMRAQIDRRSGFNMQDFLRLNACQLNQCAEAFDSHASLAERVRYAALTAGSSGTQAPYIENASFTRLREIAMTLNAPTSLTRHTVHDLAITVSARNLAFWTNFRGTDPESAGAESTGAAFGAYVNTGSIVPSRYWVLRVSAGF